MTKHAPDPPPCLLTDVNKKMFFFNEGFPNDKQAKNMETNETSILTTYLNDKMWRSYENHDTDNFKFSLNNLWQILYLCQYFYT